jgi:hypothetical protein
MLGGEECLLGGAESPAEADLARATRRRKQAKAQQRRIDMTMRSIVAELSPPEGMLVFGDTILSPCRGLSYVP